MIFSFGVCGFSRFGGLGGLGVLMFWRFGGFGGLGCFGGFGDFRWVDALFLSSPICKERYLAKTNYKKYII